VSEQSPADETLAEEQTPQESPETEQEVSGESGADDAAEPASNGLQVKIDELTSDLQRLQAEYVNYKRRVDRDRDLVTENARVSVLTALFPVLDDLDRARQHGELEGGVKAIAENLERIVAGVGLEKFGASGDEFDPTIHEALMHGHSAEVTTTTCDTVVQPGYRIGARIIRPALVTVLDPE
jgi:molecular chaperone GrpE